MQLRYRNPVLVPALCVTLASLLLLGAGLWRCPRLPIPESMRRTAATYSDSFAPSGREVSRACFPRKTVPARLSGRRALALGREEDPKGPATSTSIVSHAQANQKRTKRQGCSCGSNHGRKTVKPATTMATATSSETPIVFRRERSSRSNPRVTCTVNGTIQKLFFGGGVSMTQQTKSKATPGSRAAGAAP